MVRKLVRYAADLIWYGRGAFLANGNAIVGSLVYFLDQEKNVDIWRSAAAVSLIMESNMAAGVVILRTRRTQI